MQKNRRNCNLRENTGKKHEWHVNSTLDLFTPQFAFLWLTFGSVYCLLSSRTIQEFTVWREVALARNQKHYLNKQDVLLYRDLVLPLRTTYAAMQPKFWQAALVHRSLYRIYKTSTNPTSWNTRLASPPSVHWLKWFVEEQLLQRQKATCI